MKTILHIIRKEFLQLSRDPKMFGIILIAPIIQLIFLGYAATLDVNVVKTTILDMDKTTASRKLNEDFVASGFFRMQPYAESYVELQASIDQGKSLAGIVIPNGFEKDVHSGQPAKIQVILNGSDGNTSAIAARYIATIIADHASVISAERLASIGGKLTKAGRIEAQPRIWYNPDVSSRYFMVPAIVGLLVTLVTLLLTSLAIVKEKEIGTMEQLIVTPVRPAELIVGKLFPFLLLAFVSVTLVLVAMSVIFSIEVRGSTSFLFFASFCYSLSALGIGLFISTISRTQQQAMMITVFAVMMPMVYLSGFAFPIENMPEIIRHISTLIPLKYYITIIRGVILKGLGFADLWAEVGILFGMSALILVLSALRFRKNLD